MQGFHALPMICHPFGVIMICDVYALQGFRASHSTTCL